MLQQAIKTIRIFLPTTNSVSLQQIEDAVAQVMHIPSYADLDKDTLVREVQAIYNIRIDDFRIIEAHERRMPWINENKSKITWNFWNRYREYLQFDKNYPENVLTQLDKLTDRTLDGLFNPTIKDGISKYGLVVGQVQSGKTSNYTGLICKAADAGYKLIIVLAGIHNNLRSQTQLRLDEGFLGFDTQHQRAFDQNGIKIGVGRINQADSLVAHSLTNSLNNGDFKSTSLGFSFETSEPIIAVVKKNSAVLQNLLNWLTAQAIELPDGRKIIDKKSILLIDDEADNASINTKPEEDIATTINRHIRSILRLFNKSGYVGYTATPFANIFIPIDDEDQIFPRDFIINIPAATNYIGPDKVFGIRTLENDEVSNSVLPIVNRINDYQAVIPNGHRMLNKKEKEGLVEISDEIKRLTTIPSEIPKSLHKAIKCFIITCAIRQLRGQVGVHNSMLIHVSRFINWQNQIKTLVENVFDFYRRGIEFKTPQILEELRQVFEEDTEDYKSYQTVSQQILDSELKNIDSNVQVHNWEDVKQLLHEAASRIIVKEINGGSGDALNYFDHKNGLSVIAIGGDKLSRGLTLEGLSVSYYLRASRMYDTLMQMGRWFGYRPGYVDLCRLFTSRELNEWFCHITLASEELRSEFDYMADVARSTPIDYALKVRTFPGTLQISASNKIRRATDINVSWSGKLVETYQLSKRELHIRNNLTVTNNLIKSINNSFENKGNSYLWKNINSENIKQFLSYFKVSESLKKVNPQYLVDFINVCNRNNELLNWNIALMSKKTDRILNLNDSINVGYYLRTNDPDRDDGSDTYFIQKNHIISPRDEFIDLNDNIIEQAMKRTKELKAKYEYTYPSGEVVRNEFREVPLLLIYFLDPRGAFGQSTLQTEPIVGFAISFPNSNSNQSVTYKVHDQLLEVFDIDYEIENDNNDED